MDNTPLYKTNAVYQIYTRSFCDSNGDGIGDLQGIISKLDYLKDLGVKILWLNPIYPSPNADFGYDISDYKGINPEYGTMADFDQLVAEAGKRDMKIVMDFVINHTSNEHPWFKASIDPQSPYHDYYIWRKGKKNNTLPPNNWTSMFTGSAWTYVKEADMWYLHLFSVQQPDLNWHNPKVFEEVESILRFWLDKGVYGYRCDVIDMIYKNDLEDSKVSLGMTARGIDKYLCTDGNHEILHRWYQDIFSKGDHMVVGEASQVDFKNANRFLNEELSMVFEFDHVTTYFHKLNPFKAKKHDPAKWKKVIKGWQENVSWNANYLENHDQLRSINRFGDPDKYYKESGKMLGALNLFLRGTPFIFQGEEIGMLDYPKMLPWSEIKDVVPLNIRKIAQKYHLPNRLVDSFCNLYDRDNERMPMQWDSSPSTGFTASDHPWLPIGPDHEKINVEKNLKDPDSILNFYKAMLALRKENEELTLGSISFFELNKNVMSFTREYQGKKTDVLLNLSGKKQKISYQVKGQKLLSNYPKDYKGQLMALEPYEAVLIKIS